jgi:hypothetical protein
MTNVDHRIQGARDAEAYLLSLRTMLGDGETLHRYFLRSLHHRSHEWIGGFLCRIEKELTGGAR